MPSLFSGPRRSVGVAFGGLTFVGCIGVSAVARMSWGALQGVADVVRGVPAPTTLGTVGKVLARWTSGGRWPVAEGRVMVATSR